MTTKKAPTKSQANQPFSAEATPLAVDPDLAALEAERAELQQPGEVGRADAKQIDNDPGYDKDQLAHMREYFGT